MTTSYIGGSCTTTTAPVSFIENQTYITPYTFLLNGTVISTCFRVRKLGGATAPNGHITLIILRQNGNNWDYVGESPSIEVTTAETVITNCNIIVQTGDRIGWYSDSNCLVDIMSTNGSHDYFSTTGKQTGTNFSLPNSSYYSFGDAGVVVTFDDIITHLECVGGICTRVIGAGTDTCTIIGSTIDCVPPLNATHSIDYNFSGLPQEFLNYVSTYINDISINLNYYILPYFYPDISYIETKYQNGRFKIYIKYTPVLGMNTLIDIPQAIADLAYLIAGIILFLIGAILVVVIPGYGIIIGPIVAVFGTFVAQWSITNLTTNINSTSTRGDLSAPDKILLANEYSNILKAKCLELQPGCDTGNCTSTQMIAYNTCLGANELTITTFTGTVNKNFDQSLYDTLKGEINSDNDCLTLGTCTPQDVKDRIIIRENNTITYVNNQLNKAIVDENNKCLIPIGSVCLLTKQTATTLMYIGGGLLIGYIGYKIFVKKK